LDLLTTGIPTGTAGSAPAANDPFRLFQQWFEAAQSSEPNDPNAMALATSGGEGPPNVRIVLLKRFDLAGFVFYTNAQSRKGTELAANMRAAAVFHWKSLDRQVRLRGPVELVPDAEADAYFASRPRPSRIGAWASRQSRPLADRLELEAAVARADVRFGPGEVPRPPYWTGYRIKPDSMEFWTAMPYRLHDRLVFVREPDGGWRTERLYP
jgi:pyridoxamine 5'-phosphate oxidase